MSDASAGLAAELLRQGSLAEALTQVQQDIRKRPENVQLRIFLFQLLAVTGAWSRAANQLAVVADLDSKSKPMVETYGSVLSCEVFRGKVFSGERSPLVFGQPEEWIAQMLEALRLSAQGKHTQAAAVRNLALTAAPVIDGELDGAPFEWICDADPRLGPVCEAILNGKYYWIPLHRVKVINIDPPSDLRDVVWLPASITFANGGESVAFIPARYPGSERHSDGLVSLARKTEWQEVDEGVCHGIGQRMFATNTDDHPLLDIRRIRLHSEGVNTAG